jgi:hypothetical protein
MIDVVMRALTFRFGLVAVWGCGGRGRHLQKVICPHKKFPVDSVGVNSAGPYDDSDTAGTPNTVSRSPQINSPSADRYIQPQQRVLGCQIKSGGDYSSRLV